VLANAQRDRRSFWPTIRPVLAGIHIYTTFNANSHYGCVLILIYLTEINCSSNTSVALTTGLLSFGSSWCPWNYARIYHRIAAPANANPTTRSEPSEHLTNDKPNYQNCDLCIALKPKLILIASNLLCVCVCVLCL